MTDDTVSALDAEFDLQHQVIDCLIGAGPDARLISIVIERRGAALFANAGTGELIRVFEGMLARLRDGRLRMPVSGGGRWEAPN